MAADIDPQKQALIRAYVSLRLEGCHSTSLQRFGQALSAVTDKDVFAIGLTINGLGWAHLKNYDHYKASCDLLTAKDPTSTYLGYLMGMAVMDRCSACAGTGEAKQRCSGCNGSGQFRGMNEIQACPKCRGSGATGTVCYTCRSRGHVFSYAKASQTFESFLRVADEKLAEICDGFDKYLTKEESQRFSDFRAQEALEKNSYRVSLRLSQVMSDGTLAYVEKSDPSISSESGRSQPIFVKHLGPGFSDGDKWEGRLYLVGTYRYVTRGEYVKTVKMFSANRTSAALMLLDKNNKSDSDDSDSGGGPDKRGRSRRSDDAEGTSMGTGWLTVHGYVVTCYHVVEGHKRTFIRSPKLEKMSAKVVQKDTVNDIAILQPERFSGLPSGLPLAAGDVALAQKVFTLGYPQIQLLGGSLKFTEGTVSALRGLHDDPRCIQISVPVQSGNSGGPLLNSKGEVVGVIVSKLAAFNVFAWTGDLPQNVNFAVRSDYVKPLLGALEKREFPVYEAKQAGTEELVSRLSDSIIMVIAE